MLCLMYKILKYGNISKISDWIYSSLNKNDKKNYKKF
jgi:hypothetical protein